jgi:transcriptional regulator with XRE-family HTH domain
MVSKQAFARSLKRARTAKGLTQEDFSDISSRTYLSTLERGLKSPTLEKIEALAETMKIHPLALLTMTYLASKKNLNIDSLQKKIKKQVMDIISKTD